MSKTQSYEAAVKELEEITEKIENQEISIDELSQTLERASELIRFCRKKLLKTEEEVNKLLGAFEENE